MAREGSLAAGDTILVTRSVVYLLSKGVRYGMESQVLHVTCVLTVGHDSKTLLEDLFEFPSREGRT